MCMVSLYAAEKTKIRICRDANLKSQSIVEFDWCRNLSRKKRTLWFCTYRDKFLPLLNDHGIIEEQFNAISVLVRSLLVCSRQPNNYFYTQNDQQPVYILIHNQQTVIIANILMAIPNLWLLTATKLGLWVTTPHGLLGCLISALLGVMNVL